MDIIEQIYWGRYRRTVTSLSIKIQKTYSKFRLPEVGEGPLATLVVVGPSHALLGLPTSLTSDWCSGVQPCLLFRVTFAVHGVTFPYKLCSRHRLFIKYAVCMHGLQNTWRSSDNARRTGIFKGQTNSVIFKRKKKFCLESRWGRNWYGEVDGVVG
jgi:hypothetical protein